MKRNRAPEVKAGGDTSLPAFFNGDALRQDILSGKRKRKLRNITIKLDPLTLLSIKKVATKKGIPYQT